MTNRSCPDGSPCARSACTGARCVRAALAQQGFTIVDGVVMSTTASPADILNRLKKLAREDVEPSVDTREIAELAIAEIERLREIEDRYQVACEDAKERCFR